MKTAAFFDLDNTIIGGTNSMRLYVKYLVRKKELSYFNLAKGAIYGALHKLDLSDIEKLMDEFTLTYKDREDSQLETMAKEWFLSDVSHLISTKAKERIEHHKKQGHITCLLSSATQYICLPVKNYLKLDDSIHSTVEVKNGKLTGFMKKPLCFRNGKVFYTKLFAQDNDIDLDKSYFYTDSITDLPMLEKVGFPVAINPDPLLRVEARKRGWPIEIWSKPPSHPNRLKRYISLIRGTDKFNEGSRAQPG